MKNKPLAFQIWVVISGILLAISILLLVLFSNTLRDFFTNETYTTIENEQHVLTEYRLPGSIERRYYSEEATARQLSAPYSTCSFLKMKRLLQTRI